MKYLYDEKGDEHWADMMKNKLYYLTSCEREIFKKQSQKMVEALNFTNNQELDIIELGAGDGTKTIFLLKALKE